MILQGRQHAGDGEGRRQAGQAAGGREAAAAAAVELRRPHRAAHLVVPPRLLNRKQQPLKRPAGAADRTSAGRPAPCALPAARRRQRSLQLGGGQSEDEPHAYFLQQLGGRQPAHRRACPARRQRARKRVWGCQRHPIRQRSNQQGGRRRGSALPPAGLGRCASVLRPLLCRWPCGQRI